MALKLINQIYLLQRFENLWVYKGISIKPTFTEERQVAKSGQTQIIKISLFSVINVYTERNLNTHQQDE